MRKLGVVVFGASVYDNHKELNNPRFASSAKAFKGIISDLNITRGRETEILDLYNKSLLPNDVATQITDFIGRDYEDFIVYYCGHGDVGRRDGDYRVLLRQSNRHRRHNTLLHIVGLIHDVQGALDRKRVYFILDACYSGSAISEMETMDAGGAENLIDRSLSEAVESGNGTAVLAASGRLAVAYAKQEDKLTLFTGALVRCLEEGIAHRSDLAAPSWSDVRDEVVRTTRDRLGRDAPIPKLTSFSDAAVDITRTPFFNNRAYSPRKNPWEGDPWGIPERASEHLYWKNISDDSPPSVLEDFLTKFPNGMFAQLARGFLEKRIDGFNEIEIGRYLRDHPETKVKKQITSRLGALKWDCLKTSTDVAELEQFISSCPESVFVYDARKKIDAINIERAEVEARWEKIKSSNDPAEFDQFLKSCPGSPFEQLAKDRHAELVTVRGPVDPPFGIVEPVVPDPPQPPKRSWRWAVAGAALVALAIIGGLIAIGRDSAPLLDDDRTALDAAGTDPNKLRIFVEYCQARPSCTLALEARTRLSQASERVATERMEAESRTLDAAGNDIVKLRNFIDQCKAASCNLEASARSRLERAETIEVDSAAFDATRLQTCAQQCRTASAKAEAERKLGIIRGEENAYKLARGNASLLQKYANDCRVCKFKTAALAEVAELTKPKPSLGFSTTVGYDMNGGDIDSPDFMTRETDAATCLAKCQSTNGCIAYSFDKWIKTCYLKDKLVALTLDPRSDTSIRKDQAFPGLSTGPKRFCRYSSLALGEGPPAFSSSTAGACEQSCEVDQACAAYAFRATDKQCKLLRNTVDRQKGGGLENITSGIRTQIKCN
jgi:hypothetical protein